MIEGIGDIISGLPARVRRLEELLLHKTRPVDADIAPIHAEGIPAFAWSSYGLATTFRSGQNTYQLATPASGSSDTIPTITSTTTHTNKTYDFGLNSFIQAYQSPLIMRTGGFEAHAGTSGGFLDGALNGHTLTGSVTAAAGWDATYGLFSTFASGGGAGNNSGLVSPTGTGGLARFANFCQAKSVAGTNSTTTVRRVFGFSSNSTWPASNTDTFLGNGDSGIAVGYRSSDTSWQMFNNDGSGAMVVTAVTPTINTDTNLHSVGITWPTGGGTVTVTVDGHTQTAITTRIPATSTNLFFCDVQQESSTSAHNWNCHAVFVETVK